MVFDPGLAHRVREVLGERPGRTERKMFGGLAYLLDGKMFVGINGGNVDGKSGG